MIEHTDRELLVRIDERVKNMQDVMKTFATKEELKTVIDSISPLRKIVYGAVGFILLFTLGAILV